MAKSLKLVALATANHAIPTLDALRGAGHDIRRVLAQARSEEGSEVLPEERQGAELVSWAKQAGIDIRRPKSPGDDSVREKLAQLEPDLGVVVAYGRRFPLSLLEVPRLGWIKVHFSALPKHRGLHPIRAAIWDGVKTTGVTVIEVADADDAGPILNQERLDIEPDETFGHLAPRLSALAPELAVATVAALGAGRKIKRRKQNERAATASPRFGQRHRKAPWWLKAATVANHLRALSPEPGMLTMVNRRNVRVLSGEPMTWVNAPMGEAGSYIGVRSGRLAVLCAEGTVFGIEHILPEEAEQSVSATDFARGENLQVGNLFV